MGRVGVLASMGEGGCWGCVIDFKEVDIGVYVVGGGDWVLIVGISLGKGCLLMLSFWQLISTKIALI